MKERHCTHIKLMMWWVGFSSHYLTSWTWKSPLLRHQTVTKLSTSHKQKRKETQQTSNTSHHTHPQQGPSRLLMFYKSVLVAHQRQRVSCRMSLAQFRSNISSVEMERSWLLGVRVASQCSHVLPARKQMNKYCMRCRTLRTVLSGASQQTKAGEA